MASPRPELPAPRRATARWAGALALVAGLLLPGAAGAARTSAARRVVAGQAVHLVRTGPDIDVQTGNLRLTDASKGRLLRIAERYHKATRRRLVITGGTRTPERQAELMLEKLEHGDDLLALYDKGPALEIRGAYREGKARHLAKKRLVRAMRDVILAQIGRGTYVSRHLQAGAADVRSIGMTPARLQAFRAAVAAEPGVTIFDERDAAEPHLHLNL
jgi:hypothetical protein